MIFGNLGSCNPYQRWSDASKELIAAEANHKAAEDRLIKARRNLKTTSKEYHDFTGQRLIGNT